MRIRAEHLDNLSPEARRVAENTIKVYNMAQSVEYTASRFIRGFEKTKLSRELSADIEEQLACMWSGKHIKRAYTAPPRHGKSRTMGVCGSLTAYAQAWLRGEPLPILYVTSSGDRAKEISGEVRAGIERIYRATKNDYFAPGKQWTTLEWGTKGGLEWRATGWQSGTGGMGGRLIWFDDLFGKGKAYASKAVRKELHKALQEDLLSRAMGSGTFVGQMETRRGVDDVTGWLEKNMGGEFVERRWPLLSDDGEYLWPERYGAIWHSSNPHLTKNNPIYLSLYQGLPVPDGGLLCQDEWLEHYYDAVPNPLDYYDYILIGVDLASSKKTSSDHCAFVVIGIKGALCDILDVVNERLDYPKQKMRMRELAETWKPHAILVESASLGPAMVADLQSSIPGIVGVTPRGDKVTRFLSWTPRMAAGQVRWPHRQNKVIREARGQIHGFTGVEGEEDDIVDAAGHAMHYAADLARKGNVAYDLSDDLMDIF